MSVQHSPITINCPAGIATGINHGNVIRFSSIRYAKSERFGYPIALEVSENHLEQSDNIPVCPQNVSEFLDQMIGKTATENYVLEESCQFLSITSPKDAQDVKLPVMVWLHGGSYELGCGDAHISDPSALVQEQRIIVVSVSYRLGFFGFLGGFDQRPANLGLLDMIEGLRWIQKNISFFGGDPTNVTIMGQSSGGDAAAHLMIAENTEGLFKRVIIHSAPLGLRKKRTKMNMYFAAQLKDLYREENTDKILAAQRSKTPSVMKYGLKAAMPFGTQYGFPPLPSEEEALDRWKKRSKSYEVMIGLNDEETSFYVAANKSLSKKYHAPFYRKLLRKAVRLTTQKIYEKPALAFSKLFAAEGAKVYLFRLHQHFPGKTWGAAHCFELPLLFPNPESWKNTALLENVPYEYLEKQGKQLRKIWGSFIISGHIADGAELPDILDLHLVSDR